MYTLIYFVLINILESIILVLYAVNTSLIYVGDATQNKYATLTDCKLWEVGEEFSRKPYALAVQEGSPLKNELSSQ